MFRPNNLDKSSKNTKSHWEEIHYSDKSINPVRLRPASCTDVLSNQDQHYYRCVIPDAFNGSFIGGAT